MSRTSGGLVALIATIWGVCFVLIQASLPSPVPLLLAALRALVGGGVLAAWAWLIRTRSGPRPAGVRPPEPKSRRPRLPSLPVLTALTLANAALAFGSMYLAAGQAEAAVASILAGGQPLILAAAGWVMFGERVSGRTLAGLAAATIGVVLVAATKSGGTSLEGVALALVATTAPAIGTVLMRRLGSAVDLVATTSAQFLLGGAILVVASALIEPWGAFSLSPASIVGLLVLGVLGTGVAYIVWFGLLGRMSLTSLGTSLFLVPVVGVVAGITTGDRPAPGELAGIAAMLLGIAIVSVGGAASRPDTARTA